MRAAVTGFVIGVIWLQHRANLPDSCTLWLLTAAAFMLAIFLWTPFAKQRQAAKIILLSAFGALIGIVWTTLFALHYLQHELDPDWEGRDVTLVGTVASLPHHFDNGLRFHFLVEQARIQDKVISGVPPKIALSWYSGWGLKDGQTITDVRPGDRWRLTARLKRPHGNANPHGFDYEVWLLEQNVRATGYVRPDGASVTPNERLNGSVPGAVYMVERARGWLRDRIQSALEGQRYAGVIVALVIGDQRAIQQSDWAIFNRTGISHLVSISGLHITMIAGLFAGLVSFLWRRSFFTNAPLPLLLPAQKAAALAGAGAALLYVLLAGFGVPAQRTLYMLSVVAAALWFGRIAQVSHVLFAALFLTVLLDPWAVLWPGFWLSFGAVAIILYASVGRVERGRADPFFKHRALAAAKLAARTQLVVTLGLVPLTMLLFGQFSLIGPVANAVAIPLVGLLVAPMALVGSVLPPPFSSWVLNTAHFLIEALAILLEWLSSSDFAIWAAPVPSIAVFALALLGTLWMLAPRGWPVRWLGAAAWMPLILAASAHPKEGDMWATAFDVGQGSAVLIETSNHRLLFDAGPAYSAESDGGSRVILPYLRTRGVYALDGMIVSHNDNDHSGGALSLLKELRINWIASSLAPDSTIAKTVQEHIRCETGQRWTWDGVHFEMLHPTPGSYDSTKWKSNARSCVLKITPGDRSLLLTGDIGTLQEEHMIGSIPNKLLSTVMLVPHHGSNSSSSQPFLQSVRPQIALFQVGYRNRYGHPSTDVYQRYGNMEVARIRTDESGAIALRFGEDLVIGKYREDEARYWHAR